MFMLKAQQRFAKYPFVQYKIMDIEQDPADQGVDLNSFDLIIASDVIHATRDLSVSLGNARKLLASEGRNFRIFRINETALPICCSYADLSVTATVML